MKHLEQATAFIDYFQTATTDDAPSVDYQLIFDRLPVMIAMAFEAGTIALPIYHNARQGRGGLGLTDKSDRAEGYSSPLTVADTKIHDRTLEIYTSHFPHDKFEGEEDKHIEKTGKVTLVQDEIDGTQNFSVGYGSFSYVNALYVKNDSNHEDQHLTSIVYDPLHKVLFVAVLGRGAFRFDLSENHEIIGSRSIQVANLDVHTAKTSPYILMDTMGLGEDPVLRRVLQKIGYKVEPLSGSGLKVAVVASESVVCAVFRSQRGNPDPWDIAAASLLVTQGKLPNESKERWVKNRGLATSISGKEILDENRNFYDGYAIGAPLAHAHIVAANNAIEKELTRQGRTQNDMTPKEWDELAATIAASIQ
jgi:fructose-1,6-bisphosphatase/inositol monophosphatase family enzyme